MAVNKRHTFKKRSDANFLIISDHKLTQSLIYRPRASLRCKTELLELRERERVYFKKTFLPRRQRAKSIEGLDCKALSDNTSQGAAAGGIGYTVKRQPQPFTELSLTNFQRSSSPLMRSSLDQSDHSRPERTETTRPVLSIMVSGSCLKETFRYQ